MLVIPSIYGASCATEYEPGTTDEQLDLPAEPAFSATDAQIVRYEDTEVTIQATAEQDGLLILGDLYYPGWRAYVDGQRAPIIRANYVYRGISLPPGTHEIVFRFLPTTLLVGLGISGISLIVCLVVVLLDFHRERRTKGSADSFEADNAGS